MPYLPDFYNDLPRELKQLMLVKTNIGSYFFDAFLQIDHSSDAVMTEHPIESGSTVSDHVYLLPKKLTMIIGMSDVLTSLVPSQFTGGYSRSVTAYNLLKELQAKKTPLFIHTRLGSYQNMVITSISSSDTYETQFGLRVTVTLQEAIVSTVKLVPVSIAPNVTNSNNNGQTNVDAVNESILFQLGLFGSGKFRSESAYLWPSSPVYRISQKFGPRINPVTLLPELHNGIDIATPLGTDVFASKSGVVDKTGELGNYGKVVRISHDNNSYTLYAHLNSVSVSEGQNIIQGQVIAKSGNTGRSTGPHLHFEINENGKFIDPLTVFN